MKSKEMLLFITIITQNPFLARRAWFWHVASHFYLLPYPNIVNKPIFPWVAKISGPSVP